MAVAGSYTAESLISSVRRRGLFPSADDGVSFPRDADILAVANEEMAGWLAPFVNQVRQGHFITSEDLPMQSNVAAYPLPPRALFSDISTAQLVDANGNAIYPPLVQTELELATKWPWSNASFGQPMKFYLEGDSIVLVPTPSATNMSLRIFYPERPNQLVAATSVLGITSLTQVGNYYRLGFTASAPVTFTSSVIYESISQNPSFAKTALGVPHAVTGTYFEFAGTLPTALVVGDTLVLQDTSNVLTGVPADMFGLIAQWIVVCLQESRGDSEALQRAMGAYEAVEKRIKAQLGKRNQLAHCKVSAGMTRPWGRMPPFFSR